MRHRLAAARSAEPCQNRLAMICAMDVDRIFFVKSGEAVRYIPVACAALLIFALGLYAHFIVVRSRMDVTKFWPLGWRVILIAAIEAVALAPLNAFPLWIFGFPL